METAAPVLRLCVQLPRQSDRVFGRNQALPGAGRHVHDRTPAF